MRMCAFLLLLIAMPSVRVALASDQLIPFTPVSDAINRGAGTTDFFPFVFLPLLFLITMVIHFFFFNLAVCMDGSPSGYYYVAGSEDGARSWLVILQGGGWCPNSEACQANRTGYLGSTMGANCQGGKLYRNAQWRERRQPRYI